jgi:hypothetical protein
MQVNEVQRVLLEPLDLLALTVKLVLPEPMELLAPLALPEPMELLEPLALLEQVGVAPLV